MLLLLIVLALIYAFLNGYRDTSSVLAGVVASRAIRLAPGFVFGGNSRFHRSFPIWFGHYAFHCDWLCEYIGHFASHNCCRDGRGTLDGIYLHGGAELPSSSTHALVGGLLGAILITTGPHAILINGLLFVLVPLVIGPDDWINFGVRSHVSSSIRL